MRILWHSHSPLTATGYGVPTATMAPLLRDAGHEIFLSSFWGLPQEISLYQGIPVLNADDKKYGVTVVPQIAAMNNIDVIVTLMDVFVFRPEDVNAWGKPVIHWFPVDTVGTIGGCDRNYFSRSKAVPVVMSYYGAEMMRQAGFEAEGIPYPVDPVFAPDADRRSAIRAKAGFDGKFVVGINASSMERKGWPEQLSAFARLHREHPGEVILAANTALQGPVFVLDIAESLGIPQGAIRWSIPGFHDAAALADWYRSLDVLCSCTYAEGFCLPVAEAQACGTPVIVTDAPPVNRETGLRGRKVPGEPIWSSAHHAWWTRPSITGIHEALEGAFTARDDIPDPEAAEYIRENYAPGKIMSLWEPVLDRAAGKGKLTWRSRG